MDTPQFTLAAPGEKPRPCERWCPGVGDSGGHWRHYSRFRTWKDNRHRSVSVQFRSLCRDCELIERNQKKNLDRPLAIIKGRAQTAAHKAGKTTEFFMVNMNYESLVPELRAMMTDEGKCKGCGHEFVNERDIQIDHILPPRHPLDWARLHARNLRTFCQSCNGTKSDKPFDVWLDEQEDARIANEQSKQEPTVKTISGPLLAGITAMITVN